MTFPSPALPTPCSKAQAGLGQPRLRQTRPPPALPTSAQPGRLRSPAPSRVTTQASGAPAGLAAALRAVGRRAQEARPLGIHTATAPPATGLLQRHHLTTLFRDHAIPDHSRLTSAFIFLPSFRSSRLTSAIPLLISFSPEHRKACREAGYNDLYDLCRFSESLLAFRFRVSGPVCHRLQFPLPLWV